MAAYRSGRALPVVALTLVLAATLASCDRGTHAPPDNNRPAAVAPAPTRAAPGPIHLWRAQRLASTKSPARSAKMRRRAGGPTPG